MNRFVIPKHSVIKYLRDRKGNPRGVLVAVKLKEQKSPYGLPQVSVHYSYCNSKLDRFVKETALKIAIGRALKNNLYNDETVPPRQVIREIDSFNERVSRYYRVDKSELFTFWSSDYYPRPGEKEPVEEYWKSQLANIKPAD